MNLSQSKELWNAWILANSSHHQFPQSWEWGEILASEGRVVERYVFEQNGEVMAQVQAIFIPLFFGWKYAFVPKGPVLARDYVGGIVSDFKEVFAEQNVLFARIEPNYSLLKIKNFSVVPTIDINPRATVLLDLSKDNNRLEQEMHHKTRYNIRLAQKKGLVVKKGKNFDVFFDLMKQTAKRDGFRLHSKKHYQAIFASDIIRQITIYNDNTAIAVGVFVAFGDTFTYLYGASKHECRSLMAPYLIQWEGIQMAKGAGCKFYDFFGIAPGERNLAGEYEYDKGHQYAGVTRFKLGFGGEVSVAPGTIDLVTNLPKYRLYQTIRWLRRRL